MRATSARRPRPQAALTFAVTALGLMAARLATASPTTPTTTECLLASDASLRADAAHELRAERAQLLVCASGSCPTDIRKECIRRVEEVSTEMPTILFEARDAD